MHEIIYVAISSFLENRRQQIVAEFSILYKFHSTTWHKTELENVCACINCDIITVVHVSSSLLLQIALEH